RANEAVLKEDLHTLRTSIDQYTWDKQRAPQSLDDLVSAGYVRAIPVDPFTNSSTTWQTVQEDVNLALDQTQPGITDVHSGSEPSSSEGTLYSSWLRSSPRTMSRRPRRGIVFHHSPMPVETEIQASPLPPLETPPGTSNPRT